jgi:hypothetical protein
MDRETILKNMLTGVDPPPDEDLKKSILAAMKGFSDKQLEKMEQAGVRFWPFLKGAPPEYNVTGVSDLGTPAEYKKELRLVRISPASLKRPGITDMLRHELAHAWDDVRNETSPPNLRKLKGDALTNELTRLAGDTMPFESQSTKKLAPGKFSMEEMLDRYKKGLPERDMSFANPSTAESHVAADVMEFYAEGYSVFHGFCDLCQSRLLRLAPELYNYLELESKTYGLPAPNRDQLNKSFNDNYPEWKGY